MAALCGKDVLVEVTTDGGTTFTAVAGARTKSMSINGDTVDVTNSDSNGFRELLNCAPRSVSLSVAGILVASAVDDTLADAALAGTILGFRLTWPGVATYAHDGQITSYSSEGAYDSEVTFDMSIESSGTVTRTAL